jgi:hypothetical protein
VACPRALRGRALARDCLVAAAERLGIARDLASGVNGGAQATIEFWHT